MIFLCYIFSEAEGEICIGLYLYTFTFMKYKKFELYSQMFVICGTASFSDSHETDHYCLYFRIKNTSINARKKRELNQQRVVAKLLNNYAQKD